MAAIPILSIITWVVIGSACGWLETQRLAGKGFGLWPNIVIGLLGSFLVGYFFFVWGELVPANSVVFSYILAPFVSGLVGAGVSLSLLGLVSLVVRRG
jgi:uncharacterized membrane protein YeaQ/YmgE (transglycosylase-associated protein family)